MEACPVDAIRKRQEDGVVLVDQGQCIGCRQCLIACPFGVPQFGKDGRMQKCDFCVERTADGGDPVCVAACPTRALYSGSMEDLALIATEKAARKLAGAAIDRSFRIQT
jgi:Fe-S-cluster-containing dehydrogenase component